LTVAIGVVGLGHQRAVEGVTSEEEPKKNAKVRPKAPQTKRWEDWRLRWPERGDDVLFSEALKVVVSIKRRIAPRGKLLER